MFETRQNYIWNNFLYNSDYRVHIHWTRDDSGHNEAQRTNSAIHDSVVDGGTIQFIGKCTHSSKI